MKVIKVFTNTCSQCKVLEKNLQESGISYTSINAEWEDYKNFVEKYDISSVPVLLILDDDGKLIKRHNGILTVNGIKEFVK